MKRVLPLTFIICLLLFTAALATPSLFPSSADVSDPYARYLVNRTSDPTCSRVGQIYNNTSTGKLRKCSVAGSPGTWADVGTATAPGGSSGDIQYNNAGAFGGLSSTGTGNVVRKTSPSLITPALDVASATSLNTALLNPSGNAIEQRNSTNSQSFRLFNTYTDASNYEALEFRFASSAYEIRTVAAGTGAFRNMRFRGAGTYSFAFGDALSPALDINPGNPTDINNLTGGIEFYANGDSNKVTMRSPVEFGDASNGGSFRFNPGSAAKPTCNSANDGRVWFAKGGAGVADTFEICGKSSGDVYSWKTIVTF
jgi:hypothetical protein